MKLLARLCVLLVLLLAACSPVKKVLNNPEYFREVADSVVKRGYCVNETLTVTEVVLETIVKDSIIRDSSFVHTLQSVVNFDTTFSTGSRLKIHKGFVELHCPQQNKEIKTNTITTQTVRDRKLESILKAENDALIERVKEKEHTIKEKDVRIGELQNKVAGLTIKIYLFLLAIVLYIVYKVYRMFSPI